MSDELGDRMKKQYEDRTRYLIPRRTYTIIRLDGKAFHTFTRSGFAKPFDWSLMYYMDETAKFLCKEIQGAKFAYVQSDEISILLTDFETIHTDAWFDGNIQKMASVSAGLATAAFNKVYLKDWDLKIHDLETKLPSFDARVFSVPDATEVANYFIWRQQDAVRNSIQMAARAVFSHKECNDKNCDELQEMLFKEKGINWSEYALGEKNGRIVVKEQYETKCRASATLNDENGPTGLTVGPMDATVIRTKWVAQGAEVFTKDPSFLKTKIPVIGEDK